MKRILLSFLVFLMCSCSNGHTSSDLYISLDESKIEEDIELFNIFNETNSKNIYLANLEASIIEQAKILPINSSNTSILSRVLKSNNNPIIINGNNHYKIKDFAVLDGIVNESLYKDIINICYKENKDFKTYCMNNDISLDDTYSVPFSFGEVSSLKFYDYNDKLQNDVLLQCNDSLIEIDMFGNISPSLAKSYSVSDDYLTYTFTIKEDVYFIDSNGNKYSAIKAIDFVNGFNYMKALNKNIDLFDNLNVSALDDKTLVFNLPNKDIDFLDKIANNVIIPLNLEFFKSKGGILYPSYITSGNYGKVSSISNCLYTGAYYPKLISNDKITLIKNPFYHNENVSIKQINYIKDDSDLIEKFYDKVYSEIDVINEYNIDNNLLNIKYNDSSIRYVLLNTKRENFEIYESDVKTNKTKAEKDACKEALNNVNFRKALLSCIDTSIFFNDNKIIDSISLFDYPILVDNNSISYNDYVNSLANDKIVYNSDIAKEYYQKFINEVNVITPIKLDLLCFKEDIEMNNNINKVKNDIEGILGANNVNINIIYCSNLYDYYLAGHNKYQCYDLYFDFTINLQYNSKYKYLKEIIKYI